jgi:hypothetical protein
MKIHALMIHIATDLNNGVSRQNVCIYWDLDIDTLSFYESSIEFQKCLGIARHRKRLHVPNLLPDDLKKCGLCTRVQT